MDQDDVRQRQIVRVTHLSSGVRIMANQAHLDARRESALGKVVSTTMQGVSMVVWVQHGGSAVAPYHNYELALAGEPCD